jgi:hypothetical protein
MSAPDPLVTLIAGVQGLASAPDAAAPIAAAIRERFHVYERQNNDAEPPAPVVGQVWRNKQSNRVVRIARIDRGYNRHVWWEALTGRGPKVGRVWLNYWTSRFEFVADSDSDSDSATGINIRHEEAS